MKAWIKGGLWGLGVGFVFLLHSGFLLAMCFQSNPTCSVFAFTQWFNPAFYVFRFLNRYGDIFAYNSFLFMPIIFAIFGAFIGWIVGKIKSRA